MCLISFLIHSSVILDNFVVGYKNKNTDKNTPQYDENLAVHSSVMNFLCHDSELCRP